MFSKLDIPMPSKKSNNKKTMSNTVQAINTHNEILVHLPAKRDASTDFE